MDTHFCCTETPVTAKTLPVDTFDLVIFGGTGDLALRKLLPGLLRRYADGQIPEDSRIIGVARDKQSDADYRTKVGDALARACANDEVAKGKLPAFLEKLGYHALDATKDEGWDEFASELKAQGDRIRPIVYDVAGELAALRASGANVLFEGAQGAMLDVDHGTYPFVTSSNTVAGYAPVGTGLGPRAIDEVLGIVKAYTTRVGAGPFPTELHDDVGRHLSRVGQEFGAVTGRPRRTGWFDAVALRRSIVNNGIGGLCVTKLDVLDGVDPVRLCVEYGDDGAPRYEDMPGWRERTAGLKALVELPRAARRYLERLESACGVPVTMISTGAERTFTIGR